MNRKNDATKSPKTIQKFIYIFEFISVNQSSLTELGNSQEFIPTDSFLSLEVYFFKATLINVSQLN